MLHRFIGGPAEECIHVLEGLFRLRRRLPHEVARIGRLADRFRRGLDAARAIDDERCERGKAGIEARKEPRPEIERPERFDVACPLERLRLAQ
jgi:hypothetical protein